MPVCSQLSAAIILIIVLALDSEHRIIGRSLELKTDHIASTTMATACYMESSGSCHFRGSLKLCETGFRSKLPYVSVLPMICADMPQVDASQSRTSSCYFILYLSASLFRRPISYTWHCENHVHLAIYRCNTMDPIRAVRPKLQLTILPLNVRIPVGDVERTPLLPTKSISPAVNMIALIWSTTCQIIADTSWTDTGVRSIQQRISSRLLIKPLEVISPTYVVHDLSLLVNGLRLRRWSSIWIPKLHSLFVWTLAVGRRGTQCYLRSTRK